MSPNTSVTPKKSTQCEFHLSKIKQNFRDFPKSLVFSGPCLRTGTSTFTTSAPSGPAPCPSGSGRSRSRRSTSPSGTSDSTFAWPPGLLRHSIFSVSFLCKKSLICLEGKSMTPHWGNTLLYRSSQQLPRLCLRPLKGFLS